MRKMNFKKSAAVILSTVCMVTALVGCGSNSADADSNLSGSITAAGSSALKPLVMMRQTFLMKNIQMLT